MSILASNPGLQTLALINSVIPQDDGGGSTFQVPLRNLKQLCLTGRLRPILGVLDRLEFPDKFDQLELVAGDAEAEEVSQLAPRLLNYSRRAHALRDGLEIESRCYFASLLVRAATISEPRRQRVELRVSMARVPRIISMNLCFDLCAGLIGVIPQERVRHFYTTIPAEELGCLLVGMPNIECLWFDSVLCRKGSCSQNRMDLAPARLRVLCLTDIVATASKL